METKLKDFIHLYLGCIVTTHTNFRPNGKESVGRSGYARLTGDLLADIENKTFPFDAKPILRPLSDMTEEEFLEGQHGLDYNVRFGYIKVNGVITAYLLSKHFDLFGLIESGQAIDSTKLTPNPYKQ